MPLKPIRRLPVMRLYLPLPASLRVAVEGEQRGLEADHSGQPAEKTVRFVELHQLADDDPVEQAKIARIGRNADRGDAIDELVARVGYQPFEQGFALAGPPLGYYDFVAFAPAADHFRNQGRGILEIAIDDDDRLAAGGGKSAPRGRRLAESAGEDERLDAGVALVLVAKDLDRAVGAGVGGENDLIVFRHLGEGPAKFLEEGGQGLFLVIDGNDNR